MSAAVPEVRVSARALRKDVYRIFEDLAVRGDLVLVDTGQQRFLVVNDPDRVHELLIERAEQLLKPDSQLIETGPPVTELPDDSISVPLFRGALAKGMGPSRTPEVLEGIASAALTELGSWHDGMHLPLMPRMRRLAIRSICRASFASSLNAGQLGRAERAVRWANRKPRV